MAVQVIQLFPPTLLDGTPGEPTVIFTLPQSPVSLVLKNARVRFTNTSSESDNITAYAVQQGDIVGPGNCFVNAIAIEPNTYLDIDLPVLTIGGSYQAFAKSTKNNITVFELDGVLFS